MIWTFLAGSFLVAIISWLDDLKSLAVPVRLGVHLLAALIAVGGIGYWPQLSLPVLGTLQLGSFGIIITVMWIVAMTNIYNFMDGIDGLAGSQAVIAALAWSLVAWQLDHSLLLALGSFIAMACLGFLRYNWSPASIFMGDVGSAFLGYTFAFFAVAGAHYRSELGFVGMLVLWPFCFDGIFTIVRRWQRGENVLQAHRSHLYQRLVIAGHSHSTVTLLYSGLALLGAILGLGWLNAVPGTDLAILILVPLAAAGLVLFVTLQERAANHRIHQLETLESHQAEAA